MTNYKNISLFEGLNSLRFFAAFLVVMHHSETIRHKNGLPNLNGLGLFKDGGFGCNFLCKLSGLITYLLLKERPTNQDHQHQTLLPEKSTANMATLLSAGRFRYVAVAQSH